MRAIMSEKLRKILRDPEGRRELQKAMSKMKVTRGTEISVGGDRYKIQFMPAELKVK